MKDTSDIVIPAGIRPPALRWSNGVEEPAVLVLRVLLALLFFAVLLSASAGCQNLPTGWRRANTTERTSAWRKKSPTRFFRVEGDFDGDEKTDIAELLINPTVKKFALFVKLASKQKWQMLGDMFDLGSLDRFAIDLVRPGKYETACGKGYDDSFCAHGEPDYLVLQRPAIDFIYTESADSIFYWDAKKKAFSQVAMSD